MPKARLHFEGDNTGIEKEARLYSLTQEVEDKLDSISSIETTLQGEIDDLQDQINQVASRGRYLTTWDCTTGLPDTNPTTDPYTYRPGDYYIVGTVGGTNYRPHGSEYHVGVASQTLETQAVSVNDLYIYDGTQWTLQRTGASVYAVWGSIAGNLQAQTDLQNALNDKANRTDVLEKTNTTSYTPTTDYHPATKKYSDDNDTYIGTSAPTNNVVEGRLWYDTAADVLKVYNGSQWAPTGKTYTAGQNIQISASDVISATDTTYSAGTGISINANNEISNIGVISSNNTYDNIVYLSQSDYDNLQTKEANTLYCTPEAPDVPAVSDVVFDNTWDGVTTIAPSKNAVYDKISAMDTTIGGKADTSEINTKSFALSGTSGVTALAEAQEIFDWWAVGNTPVVKFQSSSGTYVLGDVDSNSTTNNILTFYLPNIVPQSFTASGKSAFYEQYIVITVVGGSVTQIQSLSGDIGLKFLATDTDYATPYTPQYNGSPATKKYTDEHGPNIPVYSYHGDFSSGVSCDVTVGGDYKIIVTGHHGSTIDRDIVITVDGAQAASYTSNVIENFCYVCVVSPTGGAGSTISITKSSNTSFTIYDVYIEKINMQSGYLTVTTS